MGRFRFSSATLLLFIFASSLALDHHNTPSLSGVDIERPVLDVTPSSFLGHSATHGVKDGLLCERVQVSGISRLKLGSYASSFQVSLAASAAIPERLHSKIQVCFHRNNSLGWCQCQKDEWRSVQKGIWRAVMSPYETRYVDVRINGQISGPVTIALEEDFQQWCLICRARGLALLLLSPISSWVPFYYTSSMAIGIFLVIIILLFQLGAGSFLLRQFSLFVNSILRSLDTTRDNIDRAGDNRSEPERTNDLVIEAEAALAVSGTEDASPTTPMPNPAIATASQDMPAISTTAQTLLLLTSEPQFDRTATPTCSTSAKSSAEHTDKLSPRALSNAEAFTDDTKVQMDLMLANQRAIMANQCKLQADQRALESRMGNMEQMMLQILKALQKGKDNQ